MAEKTSVDQLNSFLRGEMSAVETYRIALDKLDAGSPARSELEACLRSHQERVDMLRDAIVALGGEPSEGAGAWGAFAKTVQTGATVLGDKVAIAALEEGEDHGLDDYRGDLDELDPQTRQLVNEQLLPAQEQTHARMSALKHRLP
jgi:demethoxyubiquinone hydroxylase (CLK1/Coq7/Cat5 family)